MSTRSVRKQLTELVSQPKHSTQDELKQVARKEKVQKKKQKKKQVRLDSRTAAPVLCAGTQPSSSAPAPAQSTGLKAPHPDPAHAARHVQARQLSTEQREAQNKAYYLATAKPDPKTAELIHNLLATRQARK